MKNKTKIIKNLHSALSLQIFKFHDKPFEVFNSKRISLISFKNVPYFR